jgi:hypothetical protein
MQEAHVELTSLRCPRCAGQLVLRVLAEERGRNVLLTLDTACVACGVSPWAAPDQRAVTFTPGASTAEALGGVPEAPLAQRNLGFARSSELEQGLRDEISRLEGLLADARAEVRRSEEATRGEVGAGKRPIEVE